MGNENSSVSSQYNYVASLIPHFGLYLHYYVEAVCKLKSENGGGLGMKLRCMW